MIACVHLVFCLCLFINFNTIIHNTLVNGEVTSPILPKISLERYLFVNEKTHSWITLDEENTTQNLLVKDGDDYIINDTEIVSSILLACHAPYPIYWEMTDVKPVLLEEIASHSKGVLDFDDDNEGTNIEVKEFTSYIELNNAVCFTGLYTCRSVEENNLKKSTYMYFPGMSDQAKTLVSEEEEIDVGLNGRDSVIIPCKVTKKDAEVSLSKKDDAGNWTSLSIKKSFDPKQGFTVDKSDTEPILGTYKCFVPISKEELVVNVVEETKEEMKFPIKNDTTGLARWKQRYSGGLECCSKSLSSPSPNLLVVTCNNLPECEMKKLAFMQLLPRATSKTSGLESTSGWKNKRTHCTKTTSYVFVEPFLIQCVGNGVDISGQYATEFDFPHNAQIKFASIPPTVTSEAIRSMEYDVNATFRIQVMRWENTTYRGEASPEFHDLDLSKSPLYGGDKFVIDCCGMHFHHAVGRIQRIVWKNGTFTKLETPEKDRYDLTHRAYVKDFCYNYHYEAEHDEYLITADANMSHFECIVPRWYDRKPGVRTIQLDIKVMAEPVITSSEEVVNVTYYKNQLGLLQLECKISEGSPPPQMSWTKDGYKVNQTDVLWSVVRENTKEHKHDSLNLLFMRAKKEIEGEYVCTASNNLGMDQKTFTVKVSPRGYLDYWIALVIFGGFFALIICCAMRISTLEKQTSPKQVDPVSFTTGN